jgi:hypothetical protein
MSTRWKNVRDVPATQAYLAQCAKPEINHDLTVIPLGLRVKRYPAKWANGARKARLANRGDAPTTTHAARSADVIFRNGPHHATRALAARGW